MNAEVSQRDWDIIFQHDREMSKGYAQEMKTPAKSLDYIEARGFLCHELLFLLGGRVEFILIPWWRILKRFCDAVFGIFPTCQWYPPNSSLLQWVGYNRQSETKVFRISFENGEKIVFFIEFQPEPPADLASLFFPFNLPKLQEDRFLRPPFDSNEKTIEETLRRGMVQSTRFQPLVDKEGLRCLSKLKLERNMALWEEFTKE